MDRSKFVQYMQSRHFTEEQIEQHLTTVERFESFLRNGQPPSTLEQADAEATLVFAHQLIAQGRDTFDNLLAVARYAGLVKNDASFVVLVDLLDGAEVMDKMYQKVALVLGEQRRDKIFAGIELPPLGAPNWQKAQVTRTVMQRLEQEVDENTRRVIFADCFRDLPDGHFLADKQRYEEIGDFDEFLEWKRQEFVAQLEQLRDEGRPFFTQAVTDAVVDFVRGNPEIAQGVREGNLLYVTKIPYMTREYLAETDPVKKRYYCCHCPWARESLFQEEGPVSVQFCQCSAGYVKKPWEVIFGQPLQADVLESALQGDMRCRFAIHLPDRQTA